MFWSIIWVFSALIFFKVARWFLDPYFVYKSRTTNKDIEFWVGGAKQSK